MELTIPEQIKQCEDIIENGGCGGIECSECVLDLGLYTNGNRCSVLGHRKSLEGAKAKLKQLRGENMDIKKIKKFKEINEPIDSYNLKKAEWDIIDITKKMNEVIDYINKDIPEPEKEQEKEIEFVVGGVYESKDKNNPIHEIAILELNASPGLYCMLDLDDFEIFCIKHYENEIIEWLGKDYKYTGRTLADIIKDNK